MRCRLLQLMIPVSVYLSRGFAWLCCANMAESIEVLPGVERTHGAWDRTARFLFTSQIRCSFRQITLAICVIMSDVYCAFASIVNVLLIELLRC